MAVVHGSGSMVLEGKKIDSICRHNIEVVRVRAALRAQKVRRIFA